MPLSDPLSHPPFQDECVNESERWTCPGCYTDLEFTSSGNYTCPGCKRKIECEVITVEKYKCSLRSGDPEEEGEDDHDD